MFRVLVLDCMEGVRLSLKHLLSRYELVFGKEEDALQLLNEDRIDLILVNLTQENGTYSNRELLREWGKRKKTIVIADSFDTKMAEEAEAFGVLKYIDKLDLHKLPCLVEGCLNQAKTRVISLAADQDNE